jgi:pyocin large subunit-like protein
MTRAAIRAGLAALLAGAGLLGLAACDGGSAAPARDHSASAAARVATGGGYGPSTTPSADRSGYGGAAQDDPRREPVRLVHGKPMWAANRRHTADENAQYQFSRDGADFGASSVDDFVTKVHAFVDHPPADADTLTRRNGDKLIYEAKTNVFAVVTRDGAPRAMFKPRDGAAYWDEQKARAAEDAHGDGEGGNGYHRPSHSHGGSDRRGDDEG